MCTTHSCNRGIVYACGTKNLFHYCIVLLYRTSWTHWWMCSGKCGHFFDALRFSLYNTWTSSQIATHDLRTCGSNLDETKIGNCIEKVSGLTAEYHKLVLHIRYFHTENHRIIKYFIENIPWTRPVSPSKVQFVSAATSIYAFKNNSQRCVSWRDNFRSFQFKLCFSHRCSTVGTANTSKHPANSRKIVEVDV